MSEGGSNGTVVPSASTTALKVTGAAMPQPFGPLTGAAAATISRLLAKTRSQAGSGVATGETAAAGLAAGAERSAGRSGGCGADDSDFAAPQDKADGKERE